MDSKPKLHVVLLIFHFRHQVEFSILVPMQANYQAYNASSTYRISSVHLDAPWASSFT
jgi:hypothetical protein